MLSHRFREQLEHLTPAPVVAGVAGPAFVPCPGLVSFGLAVAPPAFVAAAYQAAQAMLAAQQKPARRPIPAFSRN